MQIAWVQGFSGDGPFAAKRENLNLVRSHAAKVARSRQVKGLRETCPVHKHFVEECIECWRANQRKQARNRVAIPLLPKSKQSLALDKSGKSYSFRNAAPPKEIFSPTPRWLQIYASIAILQFDPLYEIMNLRKILTRAVFNVMHYEPCFHALTAVMLDVHSKAVDATQTLPQEPLTHVGKAMSLLRKDLALPKSQDRAAIMTTVYLLAAFEFQRYGHTEAHKAHKDVLTRLCDPSELAKTNELELKWITTVIEQNGFSWSVKPGYSVLGQPVAYPTLTYPDLPLSQHVSIIAKQIPKGFQTLISQGKISNECIAVLQRVNKRRQKKANNKQSNTVKIPDFKDIDEDGHPQHTHVWQACPALLVNENDLDASKTSDLFAATSRPDPRRLKAAILEKSICLALILYGQQMLNSVPAMHTTMCTSIRSRLTGLLLKIASDAPTSGQWNAIGLDEGLLAQEECLYWVWHLALQTWGFSGTTHLADHAQRASLAEGVSLAKCLIKRFEWSNHLENTKQILDKFFWTSEMDPANLVT